MTWRPTLWATSSALWAAALDRKGRGGIFAVPNSGMFEVEDLNPEVKTRWVMSRYEMLRLGVRCIWAAVIGKARP
jgi:hypothetical protein